MIYIIFRVLELAFTALIIFVPVCALFYVVRNLRSLFCEETGRLSKYILFGLLLILIFFNKFFFGYSLAQPDFNRFLVPFFSFFAQSARQLAPPFWNPYFGYGFDNWRVLTAPLYGPFTVLSVFFGTYTFLNIYVILQHLVLF